MSYLLKSYITYCEKMHTISPSVSENGIPPKKIHALSRYSSCQEPFFHAPLSMSNLLSFWMFLTFLKLTF